MISPNISVAVTPLRIGKTTTLLKLNYPCIGGFSTLSYKDRKEYSKVSKHL